MVIHLNPQYIRARMPDKPPLNRQRVMMQAQDTASLSKQKEGRRCRARIEQPRALTGGRAG
jgi:hypothetical protein